MLKPYKLKVFNLRDMIEHFDLEDHGDVIFAVFDNQITWGDAHYTLMEIDKFDQILSAEDTEVIKQFRAQKFYRQLLKNHSSGKQRYYIDFE